MMRGGVKALTSYYIHDFYWNKKSLYADDCGLRSLVFKPTSCSQNAGKKRKNRLADQGKWDSYQKQKC